MHSNNKKINTTTKLRSLLNNNSITIAPGVFDGLSAKVAQQAGFNVLYASGGAIARSKGVPDIGLLTLSEVADRLRQITDVVDIPVIADADTGFGNEINVRRTVKLFEQIGVAGMHLEDQEFPKRCGHLDGKSLISVDEMCTKIHVALNTISDPDFLFIARTDAIAVEGFDKAIERAKAYLDAGAHMIFVEAPNSIEQIEQIAANITAPKLINMFYGGKTPLVSTEKLQAMGYRLVIIPSDLQRAAIKSMQDTCQVILAKGDSSSIKDSLVSFDDREKIIETSKYIN